MSPVSQMALPKGVNRWRASFHNIVYLYIINFKQNSGERSKATWLSCLITVDFVCLDALHPRQHFLKIMSGCFAGTKWRKHCLASAPGETRTGGSAHRFKIKRSATEPQLKPNSFQILDMSLMRQWL